MRKNIVSKLASLTCCLMLAAPGVASETVAKTEEQSRCVTPEINTGTVYGKLTSEVIFEEVPKGSGLHTLEARLRMRTVWKIENRSGVYRLIFLDKETLERAERLNGQQVIATGNIRDRELQVLELHGAAVPPNVIRTQGKLQYVIRHFHTGELLFVCDTLPQPVCRCWSIGYGLTIGDKTMDVVFGNEELRRRAEKLVGRRVELLAIDQGKVLAANDVQAVDGSVKTTIEVEMVGDLHIQVAESLPPQFIYRLAVGDKGYSLRWHREMSEAEAMRLSGKRVRVTGVMDGDTVSVSTLKEEGNPFIKKTVKVEITGVLLQTGVHNARGSYPGPVYILAEGKEYELDLPNRTLIRAAQELLGQEVVLTGILKNGVVKVTGIQPKFTLDFAVPC